MLDIGNLKLNYLDYMLVVNRDYTIAYASRYELEGDEGNEDVSQEGYVNRNFFEVYPSIKREISSVIRCMTTGEIVVKKNQRFVDYKGKLFCTHNITIPLMKQGQIVGVVELSKDMTTVDNVVNKDIEIEFDALAESVRQEERQITFDAILTVNEEMRQMIQRARLLARLPQPNLIYGETGTGKELFAQAMIRESGLPEKKVVIQNCASVPDNLAESILFGTSKGAYTGAEDRRGLFEEADGGIFFLDELNSLPYHVQGKLLRVLQDGTFRPVGAAGEKRVNVKIIAAMNVDPMEAIEKQHLRRDLFYRLSSGMIALPPLRERKDDILFYAAHYIREGNLIYGKSVMEMEKPLEELFLNYGWDGNVRELKNIIESMMAMAADEVLRVKDLPAYMYSRVKQSQAACGNGQPPSSRTGVARDMSGARRREDFDLKRALEKTEKEMIERTLRLTGWNKTRAGELLGIPRQTLKYKMDKWNIREECLW